MIKVKANNGVPESIPKTKFGSNFDGEFFYFWESVDEEMAFIDSTVREPEEPQKQDASMFDLDTLPDEEILKLKTRLDAIK